MFRFLFSLVFLFLAALPALALETFVDRTSFLLEDIVLTKASTIKKGSVLVKGQRMPDGITLGENKAIDADVILLPGVVLRKGANLKPTSVVHAAIVAKLHIIDPSEPSIIESYKAQVKGLEIEVDVEKAKVAKLETTVNEQAKDLKNERLANNLLVQQNIDLTAKKTELEKQVTTLTDEQMKLLAKYGVLSADNDKLTKKVNELTKEKQVFVAMLLELNEKYKTADANFKAALLREHELREKLRTMPKAAVLKRQLDEVLAANAAMYDELQEAWGQVDYYRSRPQAVIVHNTIIQPVEIREIVRHHVVYVAPPPVYYRYCY